MASSDQEIWSSKSREEILEELFRVKDLVIQERKRSECYCEELRFQREQNLAAQTQVEQEEEFIINKMMKRLEDLKMEKQNLVNQVEQEEEFLTNNLQKRLEKLNDEKMLLGRQLEEQESVVGKLQRQLIHLDAEKVKLTREKVDLENKLEAEQEYIVNKLHKQVSRLDEEKRKIQAEKSELNKQVGALSRSATKLNQDKINLENQMEMEEENIVNRLQRQLGHVVGQYKSLERSLDQNGIPHQPLDLFRAPLAGTAWDLRSMPWRSNPASAARSFNRRGGNLTRQSSTSLNGPVK
ncbi:hypothetical protein BSKO_09166 [Bryopsis sp. KO-2023]|nr:hypothetical protein BSKO_09166 [Bryopsis sp. KO-2023]